MDWILPVANCASTRPLTLPGTTVSHGTAKPAKRARAAGFRCRPNTCWRFPAPTLRAAYVVSKCRRICSTAGLEELPADLAGIGGQQDALRLIAHEFRQYIKAVDRGREASSRREAASRWAAQSGWEASPAWEPPDASDRSERKPDRWPRRSLSGAKPVRSRTDKSQPPRHRAVPAPRPPGPADILGLAGSPSRAEIIAAFRRSALVCHPDYGGSAEAFRELVAARDALLGEE